MHISHIVKQDRIAVNILTTFLSTTFLCTNWIILLKMKIKPLRLLEEIQKRRRKYKITDICMLVWLYYSRRWQHHM